MQAGVVHVELDSIQLRRLKLAEVGGPAEEVKLCKLSSQRPAAAAQARCRQGQGARNNVLTSFQHLCTSFFSRHRCIKIKADALLIGVKLLLVLYSL